MQENSTYSSFLSSVDAFTAAPSGNGKLHETDNAKQRKAKQGTEPNQDTKRARHESKLGMSNDKIQPCGRCRHGWIHPFIIARHVPRSVSQFPPTASQKAHQQPKHIEKQKKQHEDLPHHSHRICCFFQPKMEHAICHSC